MLHAIRRGAVVVAFICSPFPLAYAADTYSSNLAPQTGGAGIGVLSASFDSASRVLNYRVSYSGMSHAPTVLVLRSGADGTVIPVGGSGKTFVGQVKLSDAEIRALASGRLYLGLRNGSQGGSEIGGQVAMTGTGAARGPASAAKVFEARRPDAPSSSH